MQSVGCCTRLGLAPTGEAGPHGTVEGVPRPSGFCMLSIVGVGLLLADKVLQLSISRQISSVRADCILGEFLSLRLNFFVQGGVTLSIIMLKVSVVVFS